jgi:heme/copper-type cytochrome/quinol oxidase subunit 2
MPITVRAVSEEAYIAWLEEQGASNLAAAPGYDEPRQLAASELSRRRARAGWPRRRPGLRTR